MPFASLRNLYTQFYPPSPGFTEKDVPSQQGRVFIVTGGNAGVGFELCKLLYGTGATVYMASRSEEKATTAMKSIIESSSSSSSYSTPTGTLKFLHLDLNDLTSVKEAATTFARHETKLDVLWNNAGTGANLVDLGAKTKQGFEAMVGMHCVATGLFTELLTPLLRAAAVSSTFRESGPGSSQRPRVIWTSSYLAEGATPPHGIDFKSLKTGTPNRTTNYAVSKIGTWFLGREYARRHVDDGIISVIQNPGNLRAGSYGGTSRFLMLLLAPFLHEPRLGAYTGLYAGLSGDIGLQDSGAYVIPWGRIRRDGECPRGDLVEALRGVEEGGLGAAREFWGWCEEGWKGFL
ncbi:NAD(P)-binding protein [Aspergillus californicus]